MIRLLARLGIFAKSLWPDEIDVRLAFGATRDLRTPRDARRYERIRRNAYPLWLRTR